MNNSITRERLAKIKSWRETYGAGSNVMLPAEEAEELARMALAAMDSSESVELPLDYLHGHKDGLEWAAQLAEANHPETGDWLYDDPIELSKAIRKGRDMPPVQPVADSEPVAWTWNYREQWHVTNDERRAEFVAKDGDVAVLPLYRHAQSAQISEPVLPLQDKDLQGVIDALEHPAGINAAGKQVVRHALVEIQERRKADREPVAEVVSIYGDPEAFGEREIRPLVGIQQMPYGTKLYRHAQQPVVPEKATVGEMPFLGTSEGAYVRGWNDCRAAMLQENAKSAGVSNNCRSSENVQVMQDHQIRELVNQLRDIAVKYHAAGQLREQIARVIRAAMLQAGNSPVIPDGWTAGMFNSARALLDALYEFGQDEIAISEYVTNLEDALRNAAEKGPVIGIDLASGTDCSVEVRYVAPPGYVMVPKDLLSELRDWAHPEIEKYCEMWEGRRDSEFPALRKVISDADALLAAAPQPQNAPQNIPEIIPGWIPVSERVPESNGVYFGWDGKRVLEVNCFFGGFSANQFIHGEITHWMPLPAPPTEVK